METTSMSFQRKFSAPWDWTTSRRSASRTATSSPSTRTPFQTWRSWRRSTCREIISACCHPRPSRAMTGWENFCWETIILTGKASGWSSCTDADSVIFCYVRKVCPNRNLMLSWYPIFSRNGKLGNNQNILWAILPFVVAITFVIIKQVIKSVLFSKLLINTQINF